MQTCQKGRIILYILCALHHLHPSRTHTDPWDHQISALRMFNGTKATDSHFVLNSYLHDACQLWDIFSVDNIDTDYDGADRLGMI